MNMYKFDIFCVYYFIDEDDADDGGDMNKVLRKILFWELLTE